METNSVCTHVYNSHKINGLPVVMTEATLNNLKGFGQHVGIPIQGDDCVNDFVFRLRVENWARGIWHTCDNVLYHTLQHFRSKMFEGASPLTER